jgi:hypothetical protein
MSAADWDLLDVQNPQVVQRYLTTVGECAQAAIVIVGNQ